MKRESETETFRRQGTTFWRQDENLATEEGEEDEEEEGEDHCQSVSLPVSVVELETTTTTIRGRVKEWGKTTSSSLE